MEVMGVSSLSRHCHPSSSHVHPLKLLYLGTKVWTKPVSLSSNWTMFEAILAMLQLHTGNHGTHHAITEKPWWIPEYSHGLSHLSWRNNNYLWLVTSGNHPHYSMKFPPMIHPWICKGTAGNPSHKKPSGSPGSGFPTGEETTQYHGVSPVLDDNHDCRLAISHSDNHHSWNRIRYRSSISKHPFHIFVGIYSWIGIYKYLFLFICHKQKKHTVFGIY